MDRRQAIRRTGVIAGAAVITPAALTLLQSCQGESRINWTPVFLSQEEAVFVSSIVDTILPATDTPGALDVNVDMFIDKLWNETVDSEGKASIKSELQKMQNGIKETGGDSFVNLSAEKKAEALQKLEATSGKLPPAVWGTAVGDMPSAGFYRSLKSTAIWAYMSSEEIGKNVLNYDPVPGDYKGCIPVEEVGNRWTL